MPSNHIRIAKLFAVMRKHLPKVAIAGASPTLIGTPRLAGSRLGGLSLSSAPGSKGGMGGSGVIAEVPDDADCDLGLFTLAKPGYATTGTLGCTLTGPTNPGTTTVL